MISHAEYSVLLFCFDWGKVEINSKCLSKSIGREYVTQQITSFFLAFLPPCKALLIVFSDFWLLLWISIVLLTNWGW